LANHGGFRINISSILSSPHQPHLNKVATSSHLASTYRRPSLHGQTYPWRASCSSLRLPPLLLLCPHHVLSADPAQDVGLGRRRVRHTQVAPPPEVGAAAHF
jgi:hypothetical protein